MGCAACKHQKRCIYDQPGWQFKPSLSSPIFVPQCHPARDGQRGKCWCVDQKTGMRLPGPLELRGDLDCHQLPSTTLRDWAGRRGRQMRDQLNSTGAYSGNRMLRRLCPRALLHTGEHLIRCHNSNTVPASSLASMFPRVRGCEAFAAFLCVCQVNTLFRCFDVTDRKSLSCVVLL